MRGEGEWMQMDSEETSASESLHPAGSPATAYEPHGAWTGVRRALRTVDWGVSPRDRALIAAYYALLFASKVFRPSETARRGVHPEFWIGDVTMETSIGKFRCRWGTTYFDIVNPNYEHHLAGAWTSLFTGHVHRP